jgi:hypothetical protein
MWSWACDLGDWRSNAAVKFEGDPAMDEENECGVENNGSGVRLPAIILMGGVSLGLSLIVEIFDLFYIFFKSDCVIFFENG